mmetsp:Transcript_33231/g.73486  ORF Transcript_33231/g.73486 Transcript_33231/m.73486 type:complete len:603 (-) Transcript_33231:1668-3476(-)
MRCLVPQSRLLSNVCSSQSTRPPISSVVLPSNSRRSARLTDPHHTIRKCRAQQQYSAASSSDITTPVADGGDTGPLGQAAAQLRAFCAALPELPDDVMSLLLANNPAVVASPPEEARSKLSAMAELLGVGLPKVAKLLGKVPAVWSRSPEEVAAKLQPLASELGVGLPAVLDLLVCQPVIWNINTPALVKDRLEVLSTRLALPMSKVVELAGRQAMLWVINPKQITVTVPQICSSLALPTESALELVARMPVVLVLDPRLLVLGMNGLASTMGVPLSRLLDLVCKSLGLVAVPAEVLGSNLETLAAVLEVELDAVLEVVAQQPMMLATQVGNVANALDVIGPFLGVSRQQALRILAAQPALLYDITTATLASRLEGLSVAFGVPMEELRTLSASQPALLVIAPSTIREALTAFSSKLGKQPAECLNLLVQDPGAFVMFGYLGAVVDQWALRLGLGTEVVSRLVSNQPALLEMAPNTVKARLETIAALFDVPLEIAVQLVLKHPALATIPPNATITKVKNLSLSLGVTMQVAGNLMAKEPGVLCCTAGPPGELNRDLKPHVADIQEVVAAYEFYTMEWIQRQLKEAAPQRNVSFSDMARRAAR